eukprot:3526855-Rhodomonas_salina.2
MDRQSKQEEARARENERQRQRRALTADFALDIAHGAPNLRGRIRVLRHRSPDELLLVGQKRPRPTLAPSFA